MYDSHAQQARFLDACRFVCRCHAGQIDKAGEPVFWHVLRVAVSLLPDYEAAMVGLFHDVLEDCSIESGTAAMDFIEEPHLNEALCALTRSDGELYEDYILRIAAADSLARRVKLADLADNANSERLARAHAKGADISALIERYAKASRILHDAEFCISQTQLQEKP